MTGSPFHLALIAVGTLCAVTGLVSAAVGVYVTLANRALIAEVRMEMAELENRIVRRINGTYVRTAEFSAHRETLETKIGGVKARLDGLIGIGAEAD